MSETNTAKKKRTRKLFVGVGWVRPKPGYCWTLRGDNVRCYPLNEVWGSRKFGEESMAEASIWP